jgi:SPP1 family phage portal protein
LDGTTNDDLQNMKETRTLLVGSGATVEWLTKAVPDTHIENSKNRFKKDIYDFADCPNMTDESFANNASGVSLKQKLMGLEDRIAIKERYFKQALQNRLRLICNFFNMDGVVNNLDYREIKLQFTRNLPKDLAAEATLLNKLKGYVSEGTALSLVSFISNPQDEIQKMQDEAGATLMQPDTGVADAQQ